MLAGIVQYGLVVQVEEILGKCIAQVDVQRLNVDQGVQPTIEIEQRDEQIARTTVGENVEQ